MRNLKKVLALVLALVMSLSLVTIANAADFTDSDDIDYEEAVAVMSTIGVIEGFENSDGSYSYDPDSILTREQAAVFLYRLANTLGYDTTVSDPDAAGAFSDASLISGYAETAIAWAVENNIMNGNNNLLNPQGTATRAQIAQMLYGFDIAFQD